ncbi:MAG: hypothetical protein FD169_1951 [Bacillota bacterium]|nr:MAG: hypothetical protein FD169_1951 [Bacillota bacterium]
MPKRIVLLIILLGVLLVSSCSKAPDLGVANSFADTLQWTDFVWHSAALGDETFEKAAILLPLNMNGLSSGKLWMQLDTGKYGTVFYERPFLALPKRSYSVLERLSFKPSVVSVDAQLGSLQVNNLQATIMRGFGSPVESLEQDVSFGTVGLDLFMGQVLVLDFPSSRLAVAPSIEHIPVELTAKAKYQDVYISGGKLVVPVAGQEQLSLFFDTGSSIHTMMFEPLVWERLTNRDMSDPTLQSLAGSSWGQETKAVFAEAIGSYQIAGEWFHSPLISATDSSAEHLQFSKSYGVAGLIGNALFYDEYVVILDLKAMRFGLVHKGK